MILNTLSQSTRLGLDTVILFSMTAIRRDFATALLEPILIINPRCDLEGIDAQS